MTRPVKRKPFTFWFSAQGFNYTYWADDGLWFGSGIFYNPFALPEEMELYQ